MKKREQDEQPRKRERQIAEQKASVLQRHADRFGAKASKASSAQQMRKRAEKMLDGLEAIRE